LEGGGGQQHRVEEVCRRAVCVETAEVRRFFLCKLDADDARVRQSPGVENEPEFGLVDEDLAGLVTRFLVADDLYRGAERTAPKIRGANMTEPLCARPQRTTERSEATSLNWRSKVSDLSELPPQLQDRRLLQTHMSRASLSDPSIATAIAFGRML